MKFIAIVFSCASLALAQDLEHAISVTHEGDAKSALSGATRTNFEEGAETEGSMQLAVDGMMVVPELSPSDFVHSLGVFFGEPGVLAKVIYAGVMLSAGGLMIFLYNDYGVITCSAILCYVFALATMSMNIRNICVTAGFNYPLWITVTHFSSTAFTATLVLLRRKATTGEEITVPNRHTLMYGLIPVGLAFSLTIGLANLGIAHTNAHFYEIIDAGSVLATAGVGIALGRYFNKELLPMLCLIAFGMIMVASGELKWNLFGFLCCFGALLCRATKAQVQSMLMTGDSTMQQLAPLELCLWMSVTGFFIMSTWASVQHGFHMLPRMLEPHIALALGMAMINATILNIAGMFVMKAVGPVGQQIVGNLKGVLACVGAVAAFGEVVSAQQVVGYTFVLAGCFLYNRKDKELKAQAQKENEALLPEGAAKKV